MRYELFTGSLEDWSASYHGPKFHAVLCDPPYGLKFMGKDWDVVSSKEWGASMLPHLHPGAVVLMFGGTRTWHKLATGMEESGLQMWDTLMWLYGQGLPKGQDISKLIDKTTNAKDCIGSDDPGKCVRCGAPYGWIGYKTCSLKPAEPILAFRVPTKQSYAEIALKHGSGALNIDGTRIPIAALGEDPRLGGKGTWGTESAANNVYEGGYTGERIGSSELGRYPANLLLECTCESTETALVKQHGSVSGNEPSHTGNENTVAYGKYGRVAFQAYPGLAHNHTDPQCPCSLLDVQSGVASRFFYCPKASTSERNAGCGALEPQLTGVHDDDNYRQPGERKANHTAARPRPNHHPTVKPLALTEYLAKLLLPPDSARPRRLLVPFAGSGSEMIGALNAGWDEVVGIEREADYAEIANARLAHHVQELTA